jgi:hypothetical protein
MLYDVEIRKLIAAERADLLQAQAEERPRDPRTRRWLSERLIAAGERLAPERPAHRRPARAV